MAITVIKDYTFPFAKNDDYIYLSSDKTEEQQFRYGLHYLYDEVETSKSDSTNATISEGYIIIFTTNIETIESYKKDTLVYLDLIGDNGKYIPVTLLLKEVQPIGNIGNFKLFFDVDKLKNDSMWFYTALIGDRADFDFNMYKCVTKKVAANTDEYGVFSINDISRQLIESNLLDNDSDDLNIDFYYLPFEEYLVVNEYNSTTINSPTYNKFKVDDASEFKLSFFGGDYVIVEGDGVSFYNGVQTFLTIYADGAGGLDLTTNKPARNGISLSGGKMYRADYEATPLTDESLLSSKKTTFLSGLKLNDVSGLDDTELNTLVNNYVNGDKYFSYAPKEQSTYLNDIGYLTLANNGLTTITYIVTDSENVEHIYTLYFNDANDVYKVPSNPALINSTNMTTNAARGLPVIQECDKSYIISSPNTEDYKFNLLQDNKFMRVRLLFADDLGSLNGFNFALYNSRTIKTTKDTFTKDINDFSSLNTIKFNNQSRGKTDIATNISYNLKLNSDFLTQDEGDYFEDLLTSNNVYAQYKGDIFAVNISADSVTIKEKVNGLIRYSLNVEYSINRTKW